MILSTLRHTNAPRRASAAFRVCTGSNPGFPEQASGHLPIHERLIQASGRMYPYMVNPNLRIHLRKVGLTLQMYSIHGQPTEPCTGNKCLAGTFTRFSCDIKHVARFWYSVKSLVVGGLLTPPRGSIISLFTHVRSNVHTSKVLRAFISYD